MSKTEIIPAIISRLPARLRKNAREILETRYLAQNNARETAEILGIPYSVVVETLTEVKRIARGKSPADFA